MSNALGLTLIFVGIAVLLGLVILVGYLARKYPDTAIGRISKKIDRFIDNLPED